MYAKQVAPDVISCCCAANLQEWRSKICGSEAGHFRKIPCIVSYIFTNLETCPKRQIRITVTTGWGTNFLDWPFVRDFARIYALQQHLMCLMLLLRQLAIEKSAVCWRQRIITVPLQDLRGKRSEGKVCTEIQRNYWAETLNTNNQYRPGAPRQKYCCTRNEINHRSELSVGENKIPGEYLASRKMN